MTFEQLYPISTTTSVLTAPGVTCLTVPFSELRALMLRPAIELSLKTITTAPAGADS